MFKTVLIGRYAHGREVPIEQRRHLFENRTPPAHTIIWIAGYEDTLHYSVFYRYNDMTAYHERTGSQMGQVDLSTLRIGHVVFQVFLVPPGGSHVHPRSDFALFTQEIWPPNLETHYWPRANVLDENGLDEFAERFVNSE